MNAADEPCPQKGTTPLSASERLRLHQLRLRDWIDRSAAAIDAKAAQVSESAQHVDNDLPQEWRMTLGLELHAWQKDARDAWLDNDGVGVIKVVTGAGKTVVALAIIEELQRRDPDLRVAIVVPTIVLMNQWYDAILERSNLPEHAVDRLGGGRSGCFGEATRILIAVLASARKELPRLVTEQMGSHLFLVGDECHRVGAPVMSQVLDTSRAYSLGLSATPEREDADDEQVPTAPSESTSNEFGPIAYEMTFAQALDLGVLPHFRIDHFGLPLTAKEQAQYKRLSKSITDTRKELINRSPTARKAGGGEPLLRWARRIMSKNGELPALASRYVTDTTRRKQLIYQAESRSVATLSLLHETMEANPGARVILFHESINEVIRLFDLLESEKLPVVMEHSKLSRELRESGLELYRQGVAQIIVSARSLIEGFNVPEADLGLIVASSSSPRQRIQSIGRVLRRHQGADGDEKTSRICVLYVRDTVDDEIYAKLNWNKMLGVDRNAYFSWDPPNDAIETGISPRDPIPPESEIAISALSFGDEWPGRYEGQELTTDSLGNVASFDGAIANNSQDIPERISKLKDQPGRFKITPEHQAVLVLVASGERDWKIRFGGTLLEPFDFEAPNPRGKLDMSELKPGDSYDGPLQPKEELLFRQTRGGVVAKKRPGRQDFAAGRRADELVAVLRTIRNTNGPISKFFVNELGHAFWRERGGARFISQDAGNLFATEEGPT